jgi:hypothetical protein
MALCALSRRWSFSRSSSLRGWHGMHGSRAAPGWRRAFVYRGGQQTYASRVCRPRVVMPQATPSPYRTSLSVACCESLLIEGRHIF